MENQKKWWQSKTLWTNFILAGVAFHPQAREKVTPELLAQVLVVVNMILRFVSKDKLYLTEK